MLEPDRKLRIVSKSDIYSKATLVPPNDFGYIHIGAEVERRLPFLPASERKQRLIDFCKNACHRLAAREEVRSAIVFRATIFAPGRGAFLKRRPDAHVARFDLAILIECRSLTAAKDLHDSVEFGELEREIEANARYVHVVTAANTRRIGDVDHSRNGVFLFNYFYADDVDQNLAVWEYTAGWFEQETGLTNSVLLQPTADSQSEYPIINHCRWEHYRDIIPALIFKRSFRNYVLRNFEANATAPIPILYQLA